MRTTVTLDEDTARRIREEMKRTGLSFKETLNEAVRVGLSISPHHSAARFEIRARPLGIRAGMSYDNIHELIEQIEGAG